MWMFLILMIVVGLILLVFGLLIWKKQKVNLIHDYHLYDIKDLKGYGNAIGKAICLLGIFIVVDGVIGVIPFVPIGVTLVIFFLGFIIIFLSIYFIQKKYSGHGF